MTNGPHTSHLSFKKLAFLSISSLLFIVAITLYIFFKIQQTESSNKWVQHSLEVLTRLETLKGLIYKAGNAQKAYIITKDKDASGIFYSTFNESKQVRTALIHLVKDNEAQSENLHVALIDLEQLFNHYAEVLELVSQGKKTDALATLNTDKGFNLYTKVHKSLSKAQEEEERLLQQRIRKENKIRKSTDNAILAGSTLNIIIIMIFIFFAYREYQRGENVLGELNQSSQLQKAILNATAFAIIAVDKQGRLNHFNPAAERMLGYREKDVLGKSPLIFHLPEELARMSDKLSAAHHEKIPAGLEVFTYRADQKIIESNQWTYVRKNGSTLPVKLTITPLLDYDGNITGYMGIAYDLTQQLAFEKELIQAKEDALAGTRAKSEFLANMSHEIRTPMNAIMGMAELLKETDLTEEQKKYVSIFQSSGDGLLNIINDILDLSKIEAGNFELEEEPFRLSTLIEKASEMMAVKAYQKHLELAVDVDDDLFDAYIGDENRIRQILINLLGNAIKFTRKGEVVLRLHSQRSDRPDHLNLIIEIQDSGIGMTQEQIDKLFQRFVQADSSINREFGGTGLGLNISKKLVTLMKGDIEVRSIPGLGSTFKVTVPLKKDPNPVQEENFKNLTGIKFLIVDDTKINRFIMKKIIQKLGGVADEAENGKRGYQLYAENRHKYDMILLDYRMPDMDGFTLAKMIREDNPDKGPLILMLTSDSRAGDLAKVKHLGLNGHLMKPILRHELLNAIYNGLNHSGHSKSPRHQEDDAPMSLDNDLRILLVDDNEENRFVIKAFLKDQKCSIDEAKNGRDAIVLFQQHTYDLVLMDMQMPIMDGYTATGELRKIEKENGYTFVPILALSAYALSEEIKKSVASGCNGHLVKPISKNELLQKIKEFTSVLEVEVPEELQGIAQDYLLTRKAEVEMVEEALNAKKYSLLVNTGHKLRGTAGSYGFNRLSEIGKDIEECAKAKDDHYLRVALLEYRLYLKLVRINYS